ncbi:Endonuclease/exonuclease/phosphatase [Kickxella alabastrina]|uniref:Endonuclease/exonuclease/phosphatase n=1 Tax=Kickxella alabastrina TaxID=61397 RepID=UPI00221EFE90|nr:Endonuclease/exonuclease/phosphatase [Kickxella alabastrina]KAI7826460.1 Endonuclease/exonuclease/phosphatase [Kickxella alabastrina]
MPDGTKQRQPSSAAAIPRPLRVVQWNIERGYQLDAIIATLKRLDADILCLQEIDICNERSGNTNHAEIIAEQLGLNAGIVVEFQELKSPCRSPSQQGGGLHGNAIYSRFDMKLRVIDHAHQPFNWPRDGVLLGEPRVGRRCTLVAEVAVPRGPPVLAYSAHFECFTGIIGSRASAAELPHQIIFGDFNTFAHSWRAFRQSTPTADEGLPPELHFSGDILRAAVNPGWWDPFDAAKDITISNHGGWMTAKADWAFVRQLKVVKHWMENRDFTTSDHRCLVLDVEHAHADILELHKKSTRRTARELQLKRSSKFWTWFSLLAATSLSLFAYKLARTSIVSSISSTTF